MQPDHPEVCVVVRWCWSQLTEIKTPLVILPYHEITYAVNDKRTIYEIESPKSAETRCADLRMAVARSSY